MDKKYNYSVWKKKTASAQVKLYEWKWDSLINWKNIWEYITRDDLFEVVFSPLKLCKVKDSYYFEVTVDWSWVSSQAYAMRHALAKMLAQKDETFKKILKSAWFLTRDSRKVERKKPGKHKARKSSQWSKR